MGFQKYSYKPKTIFFDLDLKKPVSVKGKNTITFRSALEYSVYEYLYTLIDCDVYCQIPIKGNSFTWVIDFMLRSRGRTGKDVLNHFRELMGLPKGGSIYIEAKGAITKEFSEKLNLCSVECPNVYKNLLGFGDTPLGLVLENGFKVDCFPIRSLKLLQNAILECNNAAVRSLSDG